MITIRGQMIALQEELDWEVYWLYGLLTDQEAADLQAEAVTVPELNLGERAFEIVLARQMAAGRDRDPMVRAAWVNADHARFRRTGRRHTGES